MLRNWRAWLNQTFRDANHGKSGSRARTHLGIEVLEDRCVPAITMLTHFSSINYHTNAPSVFNPPDTTMAAGPNEVISAGNTAALIQGKATGTAIGGATQFSQIFALIRQDPNGSYSNPQIVYDASSQRFFMMVLEIPSTSAIDYLDLAVSKTNNPTNFSSSSWTVLPVIKQVNQGSIYFADNPHMAVNSDALFISFNTFGNNAQTYIQNDIFVFSKSALLTGAPLNLNANFFDYSIDRQTVFNVQTGIGNGPNRQLIPAMMDGAQPGNLEYFVADEADLTWNATWLISIDTMQNYLSADPKNPMTLSATGVMPNERYWVPEMVQQLVPLASSTGTNSGKHELGVLDNIQNADWDNGFLVASQNIGPSSNPGAGQSFTQARYYELATGNYATSKNNLGDILNEATRAPGPGIDTSFPSVAVDPNGDIAMTYIQTSATMDPTMYVTGRQFSDTPNLLQSPILIAAGTPGLPIGTAGGMTAACQYDSSDYTFWAADEYTFDGGGLANTDNWGIAIANFSADPDVTYVVNVYERLLGRVPDSGGLKYWADQLKHGTSPANVVLAIEATPEYLSGVVASMYREYLYRPVDPAGLAYWTNRLLSGMTIVQLEATFASSTEYFKDHNNNQLAFVDGLYVDILGRVADANATKWVYALNSGVSRYQVATDFLLSTENLTKFVTATYNEQLGRPPDAAGLAYWIQQLQAGLPNQVFLADIIGSAEGFAKLS